jgi:hypothetical protein
MRDDLASLVQQMIDRNTLSRKMAAYKIKKSA